VAVLLAICCLASAGLFLTLQARPPKLDWLLPRRFAEYKHSAVDHDTAIVVDDEDVPVRVIGGYS
jgi:hypothetical protein